MKSEGMTLVKGSRYSMSGVEKIKQELPPKQICLNTVDLPQLQFPHLQIQLITDKYTYMCVCVYNIWEKNSESSNK